MTHSVEQIEAGQAVYSRRVLSIYDVLVLGLSNRFIWKCPSKYILNHYNSHITSNHLDVGVGTGYFLDRCSFPKLKPYIALMDLNQNTLDYASRRIARYRPRTYQHDVFQPVDSISEKFDSIGINYLLHCLPDSIESKAVVLDNL